MEVIRITNANSIKKENFPPLALAIGYFDGVHLGHQEVINTAIKKAKSEGWKSAVMSFDPSPKAILGKNPDEVRYITLLDDKIKLMDELGVDYFFIVPFTREFAQLGPEQFIVQYIIQLNVKHLVAGYDFTYGKFGKGNMETIHIHSQNQFEVTTIPKITICDEKISSTYIRNLIQKGEVYAVPKYLGRYYTIKGTVVHGEKRGRQLGFPTANIAASVQYVYPKNGIYAVRLFVRGSWHEGVCSIGFNPTFNDDESKKFVEIYLLEFKDDIYGEEVIVEWHKWLRGEEKFENIDELIVQMEKDKLNTIAYFQNLNQ